jgi:hypothetical protein
LALRSAPDEVAEAHLRAAGLSRETIDRDVLTIRATTVWLARRGGKLALQVGKAMLEVAGRQLRSALAGREPDTLAPRR